MAGKNAVIIPDNDQVRRKLTQPAAGGIKGDPGLVGDRGCVLESNQDANGYAVVRFVGEVEVMVHGQGASAAAAGAENAVVYYDAASGTDPRLNFDATNGVRWGLLVTPVASAAKTYARVDVNR